MHRNYLLVLALALAAASCAKRKYNSQTNEFALAKPEGAGKEISGFSIPRLTAAKIPHKGLRKSLNPESFPSSSAEDEKRTIEGAREMLEADRSDFWTVDVLLGPLSDTQFTEISKHYGGKSNPEYVANKIYSLMDFLPPQIQALEGHVFQVQREMIEKDSPLFQPQLPPGFSQDASVASNCWNALIEILRGKSDSTSVYWTDQESVLPYLKTDPSYSTPIVELTGAKLEPGLDEARKAGVKTGDYALIFIKDPEEKFQILAHVAYVVDDNIYFEKTNGGSNDLYRLNDYSAIFKSWSAMQGGSQALRIEYRRPTGKVIPSPQDAFSLNHQNSDKFSGNVNKISTSDRQKVTLSAVLGMGGNALFYGIYRIVDVPFLPPSAPGARFSLAPSASKSDYFWSPKADDPDPKTGFGGLWLICDFPGYLKHELVFLKDGNVRWKDEVNSAASVQKPKSCDAWNCTVDWNNLAIKSVQLKRDPSTRVISADLFEHKPMYRKVSSTASCSIQ
jgi:hypothetical protein